MSDDPSTKPVDPDEELDEQGKPIKDKPDNRGQSKDKGPTHDQGGGNDPEAEPK